jgi:hypothetical protein
MKVVGASVPVLTRDIDRAIPHYETMTGERVKARFVVEGTVFEFVELTGT